MNNATEAKNVLLGVYRDMVSDNMYALNLSIYFDITNDFYNAKVIQLIVSGIIRQTHLLRVIHMYKTLGLHYITLFMTPMIL